MSRSRSLSWGGLHNTRDLGGLPGRLGATQFGRVYRSPRLDSLDADGWGELTAAGVTTIVDLRNGNEVAALPLRPESLRVLRRPVEDQSDAQFTAEWGHRLGSPVYYAESIRRWPSLVASALLAVADAPAGGVLVHCSAGRDRTGLISALLLEIAGVEHGAILDDYELGMRETNAFLRNNPQPHETAKSDDELESAVRDARSALTHFLAAFEPEAALGSAGVGAAALHRIRERMLAPVVS